MKNIDVLSKNLIKNGFQVSSFDTAESAVKYLRENIRDCTVGIGGSTTVDQLGLYEILAENNEVFWHWKQSGGGTFLRAAASDVYICSANGVSETGEIVNIDAVGNRLSTSMYGHKKVYIIIGLNKVVPSLEEAIYRARNVAAPLNAKRLGLATPCAVSEEVRCFNCNSPQRICKGLLIWWKRMSGVDECEVIVINESLGY